MDIDEIVNTTNLLDKAINYDVPYTHEIVKHETILFIGCLKRIFI